MTGTFVKGAGSAAKAFFQPSAAGKTQGTGFQQVLDSHTGKSGEESQIKDASKTRDSAASRTDVTDRKLAGESLQAKEANRLDEKNADMGQVPEELTEEELAAAMEALGSAVNRLQEELAQILGISMEELQAVMDRLDMQPADLLNQDKLTGLFLKAAGADSTLSLLTDNALYQDYKAVLAKLDAAVQQLEKDAGMDVKELLACVQEKQDALPELESAAAIEVTAEQADAGEQEGNLPGTENRNAEEVLQEAEAPEERNTRREADGGQSQNSASKGGDQNQESSLLLQNLKAEGFQGQVSQAAETASVWNAETQDIMKQILDYMKIHIKTGESTLEMQLHPENLGTVQVHIASKGGAVTAHFVTQNETVKAVLESQMIQLQESFQEQGVKVEAVEVTVQAHEFERNLDQGRGRQQEEPSKKQRTRRLNLSEVLNSGELEEEDAIAADIMSANGSTVDYTA